MAEEDCNVQKTVVSIRKQSPFTRYFNDGIVSHIADENESDQITNASYSPGGFAVIRSHMYLYPLWAGALQTDISRFASDARPSSPPKIPYCRTNSAIESHFKGVKHGRLRGKLHVRPREFVDAELNYVLGKVNETFLPVKCAKKRKVRTVSPVLDAKEKWRKRRRPARYASPSVAAKILANVNTNVKRRKVEKTLVPATCVTKQKTRRVLHAVERKKMWRKRRRPARYASPSMVEKQFANRYLEAKQQKIEMKVAASVDEADITKELDGMAIGKAMEILKNTYPDMDGLQHPALGAYEKGRTVPRFEPARKRFVQVSGNNVMNTPRLNCIDGDCLLHERYDKIYA